MKVICISDKWKYSVPIHPIEENIYTVIDCEMIFGVPNYQFREIPKIQKNRDYWWVAKAFVPLDTYKEKEISELKEELQLL